MPDRYITAKHADAMRKLLVACQPFTGPMDHLRGVIGTRTIHYYVVPDDDPRLQDQPTPDGRFSAE